MSDVLISASRMALRSRSSRATSALFFVVCPLAPRRLARGDDADDFFAVLFDIGVNHYQKQNRTNESDGGPALLAVLAPIRNADVQGIVEYTPCDLEA